MRNKQRRFADDGWALWIDGDDRSTIYLNEWINPNGNSYVDVSVRIYGARDVKTVNFFVPFEISLEDIFDLSDILTDKESLRSLFNANGEVDSEKNEYTSELRYDTRTLSLINLTDEYIKTKSVAHGTVVTVDFEFIKDYITADEAYIIFRIPHKTIDEIFSTMVDGDSFFEKISSLVQTPIISKKYNYSIRINEARLLPVEINKIEALKQQRIRKALVSISIAEAYEMNDSTCQRIRRLEEELNRKYAPKGYDCSDAIIYQWVEERNMDMRAHYNFFFVMEHRKTSHISIMIYLLIVVLCSGLGSAIYDLVKYLFGKF